MAEVKEGWMYTPESRKRHFLVDIDTGMGFVAQRSLCGKWDKRFDDYFRMDRDDENLHNCAACKRKLKARKDK